ncbi:MAG: T9SS type A sorting domain-containing protein [Bacteroidia bacterium]
MLKRTFRILTFVLAFGAATTGYAQSFLNGSFEINTATACDFNMANAAFTSAMSNCVGYGVANQLDIMQGSCTFGVPQNGSWMVSLATNAGNTDAFTTMLSAPLVAGTTYTMRFYDKGDPTYPPGVPIQIGISTTAGTGGTIVYTAPTPLSGTWSLRSFSFVAPNSGQYVSVSTTGAPLWTFVDNFCLNCPTVLPVELTTFTGECRGNVVVLNWSTVTEKNNDYFSIERSENGIDFIQLGTVKGSGKSDSRVDYTFTDKNQLRKQAYYRLKQTDFNQDMAYSRLIAVDFCRPASDLSFEAFPNPADAALHLAVKNYDESTLVKITDRVGKTIYEGRIEAEDHVIDVAGFSPGFYFIQLLSGNQTLYGKFIKN